MPIPSFSTLQARSLCVCLSLIAATQTCSADWPSWRGPKDSGSIPSGDYPGEFSESNLVWNAPLPGKGCSTPIIVDKRIYVTAPVDGNDALLCFDWDGKPMWTATFGAEDAGRHRNGSGSNSSPVSDGKQVFVSFKSGNLAAVNLNGEISWQTNLVQRFGKHDLYWDFGTSPVLTQSDVVMARMHEGDSWVAAFDKESGKLSWKVARNFETPQECDHGYSSPLVIQHGGRETILVWGAQHVTLHDAVDGKETWRCGNFNPDENKLWPSIATPVMVDDMIVIAYGRNDRNIPRLHGVRLGGSGDVTETNHIWLRDDIGTFVPTPVAHKGRVYLVRDRGEVECIDPATGKNVWSGALPKGRAKYYASPLIAGDVLYAPREDGVVFVARIGDEELELLSENDMGEPVIGSPVPLENRIFIRGEGHLYCYQNNAR